MAMIEAIARMIAIIAAMIIATSGAIAMNDATRSAACTIIIAGATGAARLDRAVGGGCYRSARKIEIEPVGVAMNFASSKAPHRSEGRRVGKRGVWVGRSRGG